MNNDAYWEKRVANYTWGVYNNLEEKNMTLKAMYDEAAQDIENSLFQITKKIQRQGTVSLTDMHRYNRLTGLKKNIEDRIRELSENVEEFAKGNMQYGAKDVYKNIGRELGKTSFDLPNEKTMEMIYKKPWKGSNFSSRLWRDAQALEKNLNSILTIGITQGKTITEMALQLSNEMNKGFNVCHRLVRTETMHYLNESSLKSYEDFGVKEVKFWAAEDERTCEKCGSLHGKTFKIKDKKVLPLHAHCRCTYIPVVNIKNSNLEIPTINYLDRQLKEDNSQTIEDGMAKLFKEINKSPTIIKKLLLESANEVNYEVTDKINRAFKYSPTSDTILINPKHSFFDMYDFTESLTHELGHRIDYKKLNLYNDKEFVTVIRDTMNNIDLYKVQKAYNELIEINDSMSLSDILSGLSNNKIDGLLSGHDNSYWAKKYMIESEMTANLVVLFKENDKNVISFIYRYMPDIVKVFKKHIKGD